MFLVVLTKILTKFKKKKINLRFHFEKKWRTLNYID